MDKIWAVCAHPDDELLGLGTIIREKGRLVKVIYPLPIEDLHTRANEARSLGKRFGFEVSVSPASLKVPRGVSIYMPSVFDPHPEHQAARTWALRHLPVSLDKQFEYSIRGKAPYSFTSPATHVAWKQCIFHQHYTSQRSILSDASFFLFEGTAPLSPAASISVTFRIQGAHQYPSAPDEVSFLREIHRHMFHVKLTLTDLWKSDREVEFLMLQEWARSKWSSMDFPADASCELMARMLGVAARTQYGVPCEVEVWEDGENGAKVRV